MSVAKLSKQCYVLAKTLKANFTLNGNPIPYTDVFAENGMFPAIAKRAEQLCSLCLGYGLGATFTNEEKSMLGVRLDFDEMTPDSLRLLCILDVLSELIYTAPSRNTTPLDELLYD